MVISLIWLCQQLHDTLMPVTTILPTMPPPCLSSQGWVQIVLDLLDIFSAWTPLSTHLRLHRPTPWWPREKESSSRNQRLSGLLTRQWNSSIFLQLTMHLLVTTILKQWHSMKQQLSSTRNIPSLEIKCQRLPVIALWNGVVYVPFLYMIYIISIILTYRSSRNSGNLCTSFNLPHQGFSMTTTRVWLSMTKIW